MQGRQGQDAGGQGAPRADAQVEALPRQQWGHLARDELGPPAGEQTAALRGVDGDPERAVAGAPALVDLAELGQVAPLEVTQSTFRAGRAAADLGQRQRAGSALYRPRIPVIGCTADGRNGVAGHVTTVWRGWLTVA